MVLVLPAQTVTVTNAVVNDDVEAELAPSNTNKNTLCSSAVTANVRIASHNGVMRHCMGYVDCSSMDSTD